MTLSRDDMLRELELLPMWRLRDAGIKMIAGEAACATTPPSTVAQAASPAISPLIQGVHNRGYLPHLKAEDGIYFVTFRLSDSLPEGVLAQLEETSQQERSRAVEKWLDQGHGECLLANAEYAGIVREAIMTGKESEYHLHAWCIMPNHVHLVLEPLPGLSLSEPLQRIKSWSAHEINARAGRSGCLWQRESFDHLIRDDSDLARCCDYVRLNPVRAQLAASSTEYAFCDSFGARNAGEAACATIVPSPIAQAASPASVNNMGWNELKAAIAGCQACSLAKTRTQTVFGVGDEHAEWLFVGEAPGAEEDRKGEPFVGQAGKLLDNMLAAIQLKRGENVYIANVLKCRPPNNRDPHGEEVVHCDPFLKRQVELIKPRLIVALGKFAALSLLGGEQTISAMRGKLYDYHGVPVIVTYHPAYLLRNLPDKAKAWEDLCFARSTMRDLQSAAAASSS